MSISGSGWLLLVLSTELTQQTDRIHVLKQRDHGGIKSNESLKPSSNILIEIHWKSWGVFAQVCSDTELG
jgi:UDP-galactopyranose mutase